jgi:hypothetical protein
MRASAACGVGVQAAAKIDHFGEHGRVRGDLLLYAFTPARLRLDVVSSFNVAVATLTSDGARFALADLRDKRFLIGPASPCNIARLTTVPLPGHALVSLLRGQAPVLKHEATAGTIAWDGHGYYRVVVPSTRGASQEILLTPHPDDFERPWGEQRLRVLRVVVRQEGYVLYDAELSGHGPTPMATARIDAEGIDPPIPPSGPTCTSELPRTLHVEAPLQGAEVLFTYDTVTWNPPLPEGIFEQARPAGMELVPVRCE